MVDVEALGKLARIAITAEEKPVIEQKVSQILEYFNRLSEINTDGVEPFFHATTEMELRPDVPEAPIPVEDLMRNAPDAFENCFRIPKVVGEVDK